MKSVLKFLSISTLCTMVVPSVTACSNNVSSEFKKELEAKLTQTDFKVSKKDAEKDEVIKEQSLKIIEELNKQEKYHFDLKPINLIFSKDSEFTLFFYFYKIKDAVLATEIQTFNIKLPYIIE